MVAPSARVLLVGMMGSGKTTIGLSLARRTGWRYVDNDQLLMLVTGRTARELLTLGGDASLRTGEAAAVERALEFPPPVIVGIAGGVVLDPAARRRLREVGHVVWLRAKPATLIPRLGQDTHRPSFESDRQGWVERAVVERDPLYRDAAHSIVDVDGRAPDEITHDILAALQTQPASGRTASPAPEET
jgi:shikimate kinase